MSQKEIDISLAVGYDALSISEVRSVIRDQKKIAPAKCMGKLTFFSTDFKCKLPVFFSSFWAYFNGFSSIFSAKEVSDPYRHASHVLISGPE